MRPEVKEYILRGIVDRFDRRQKGFKILENPRKFARKYLAWDLYKCQEDWYKLTREHQKLLVNAPVDHGKSGLFSFVLPLMEICRDPNIRIIFGTSSPRLQYYSTRWIRDQLQYNKALIHDFGPFYNRSNPWGSTSFTVIRPARNLRDPTFTACTIGSMIEGIKGDIGILDDPIDRKSAESEVFRMRALSWFGDTYLNRLPEEAPLWIIGTRWHPEDLYKILSTRNFYYITQEAINEDWAPESVLCPERWTADSLQRRRVDIGAIAFNQKFLNNPRALIGQKLDPDWLNYYTKLPRIDKKVIAIDPAIGQTTVSDYFAAVVVGLGSNRKLYVLHILRDRLTSPSN